MSIKAKQDNSDFKRLYRGAFDYVSDGKSYTEEKFEIFKDKKTMDNHYEAEIVTRVSTGQILNVEVSFIINKSWIPQDIIIKSTLGTNFVNQRFTCDQRRNTMRYLYESPHSKKDETIITPPKFHIQTPAASCSMTFIPSKKIDQTVENFYYTYVSPNSSLYKGKIFNKNVVIKRAKLGEASSISLGENSVSATEYIVYDDLPEHSEHAKKPMRSFLSKHLSIPYKIEMDEKNYIQIKYLNDFTETSAEDDSSFV